MTTPTAREILLHAGKVWRLSRRDPNHVDAVRLTAPDGTELGLTPIHAAPAVAASHSEVTRLREAEARLIGTVEAVYLPPTLTPGQHRADLMHGVYTAGPLDWTRRYGQVGVLWRPAVGPRISERLTDPTWTPPRRRTDLLDLAHQVVEARHATVVHGGLTTATVVLSPDGGVVAEGIGPRLIRVWEPDRAGDDARGWALVTASAMHGVDLTLATDAIEHATLDEPITRLGADPRVAPFAEDDALLLLAREVFDGPRTDAAVRLERGLARLSARAEPPAEAPATPPARAPVAWTEWAVLGAAATNIAAAAWVLS